MIIKGRRNTQNKTFFALRYLEKCSRTVQQLASGVVWMDGPEGKTLYCCTLYSNVHKSTTTGRGRTPVTMYTRRVNY